MRRYVKFCLSFSFQFLGFSFKETSDKPMEFMLLADKEKEKKIEKKGIKEVVRLF